MLSFVDGAAGGRGATSPMPLLIAIRVGVRLGQVRMPSGRLAAPALGVADHRVGDWPVQARGRRGPQRVESIVGCPEPPRDQIHQKGGTDPADNRHGLGTGRPVAYLVGCR
jgi:hypothetical protein